MLHWLNHVVTDAEYIIILDADMIMRGPITPWEFGAQKDLVVAAPYEYVAFLISAESSQTVVSLLLQR